MDTRHSTRHWIPWVQPGRTHLAEALRLRRRPRAVRSYAARGGGTSRAIASRKIAPGPQVEDQLIE